MSAPIAPNRVLPTLNADGSRHRIRPKLFQGRTYGLRQRLAWLLMLVFVGLPFLKIAGKPAILLDVPRREFTLLGQTFYATEGVLLMLLLLALFLTVIWVTALVGRSWCGWACPQTVYMEFLFRPLERLFEGSSAQQRRRDQQGLSWRRALKNATFLALAAVLGNAFLAYFVGVDTLSRWVARSPAEHPTPFLVMAATTALVFFNFAYFREQMCTIVCPYARLQSVLLDKRSLIVGYDARRGEPRHKGKPREGAGDCIDCNACVATCPTGIDIRQGLQLECIACAQCIDACDSVMAKLGRPLRLIGYGSQEGFERGTRTRLLRPRVIAYTILLAVVSGALVFLGSRRAEAEVTVLRGIGAPFRTQGAEVISQIRVKVQNRTWQEQRYRIEILDGQESRLIAPENPLVVATQQQRSTSIFVVANARAFARGERQIQIRIATDSGFERIVPFRLLGPVTGVP